MIDNYIAYIAIAVGLIIITFSALYMVRQGRRKEEAAKQAANAFREIVLNELKGVYPIPRYLDKDVCDKFKASIPAVESAAAEFRKFMASSQAGLFDDALKTYCDHCNKITWESCVTYNLSVELKKPEDEGPKEIFRQNVNALLSFVKEE